MPPISNDRLTSTLPSLYIKGSSLSIQQGEHTLSIQKQAHSETLPVLPIELHYRSKLSSLPQLTTDQEHALLQRAYAGEDVRNEVVLSLQRHVYALAGKHMRRDKAVERMDLVQSALTAVLYRFERALTKENPFSYLLQVADLTMVDCVNGRGDAIKNHNDDIAIISLDQPDEDGISLADTLTFEVHLEEAHHPLESTFASLCEAIEGLPEKQRMVIQRHYGFDSEPQSLNMISRSLTRKAKSDRPANAHYHSKRAHAALRSRLASLFPQYAVGGAL